MPPKKPLVIVTRKLPDVIETRMMELFDARLNLDDTPMTQAQLVAAVQQADVLVPTITDRIDAAVLAERGFRYTPSYLVESDECRLLVDCGSGIAQELRAVDPMLRAFTNVNTPEELASALGVP